MPANLPRVSIRRFGARGDGRSDDSAAFQTAHDQLPDGGIIVVEPGTYLVGPIRIRHRFITVELAPDAVLRRTGQVGPEARGMFNIENLREAHFALRGGRIDLNGEGPMRIGEPGRIPNLYAAQTIARVKALAGPANAAVFALRSSHVTVADTLVENSGETGVLLRNSSDTVVERCQFRNIANYGVEWSIVAAPNDGGHGTMPDRSRHVVRGCSFEDHDDYGLGSGNGAGIGGGGAGGVGPLTGYSISDCTFLRCQRDINFELLEGGWLEGLEVTRIRSREARQSSFGFVGARNSTISDYVALNTGAAPTSGLGPDWATICGGFVSTDFRGITLRGVQVLDDRGSKVTVGADGEIAAGTRLFGSRRGGFAPTDVGTFIGIRGANPEGVCYVGRIQRVLSPTEVELDLPAAVTVRDAEFAYGGACREGLRLYQGTSVALDNCRVQAGTYSGLPGEPPSAGIRIENVRQPVPLGGTIVSAPPTRGSTPIGIDLIRSSLASQARVTGFARNLLDRS